MICDNSLFAQICVENYLNEGSLVNSFFFQQYN